MPDESPAAAPPAAPPGVWELLEQSLLAFARAPSVFAAASQRPAPSFGAAAGLIMASGATALAAGLAENQAFLQRFPPVMIAAMAAAALGLYAGVLLLFAVLLYGLGRSLGGTGEFDRAMQAAAAISLLTPLQVMCGGFPAAWALPPALAAWVATGALEGLFKAKPLPARAACALLAGAAIGLQFAGRIFIERAGQAYALTQATSQIQSVQMPAAAAPGAPAGPAATATSGLDLLRAPAGEADTPAAVEAAPAAAMKDAAEVQRHASAMLGSLAPMLNDPALTRNMSPQQKSDLKDLQALMKDLQAQMQPGAARLSEAEQARRMAQIQRMTMRMMLSAAMRTPPTSKSEAKK